MLIENIPKSINLQNTHNAWYFYKYNNIGIFFNRFSYCFYEDLVVEYMFHSMPAYNYIGRQITMFFRIKFTYKLQVRIFLQPSGNISGIDTYSFIISQFANDLQEITFPTSYFNDIFITNIILIDKPFSKIGNKFHPCSGKTLLVFISLGI